jgi:hypothetical protein
MDEWVSANSKVMVIGWKYSKNCFKRVSHLSVYDLEAVKKRNSDPSSHLLYTLQFKFDIHSFVMNENEIAFSGEGGPLGWCVTVLKFANLGFAERKSSYLKENPEVEEDSDEEIVQMKVKKIIYDRVDFDDADYRNSKKKTIKMKMKKIVNDFVDFDDEDCEKIKKKRKMKRKEYDDEDEDDEGNLKENMKMKDDLWDFLYGK